MPKGNVKSGTKRRRVVTSPGGKQVTHYIKRNHALTQCAKCGNPLLGVPRRDSLKVLKVPRSKRVPHRPYGGVLCSKCSKEFIKLGEVVENV